MKNTGITTLILFISCTLIGQKVIEKNIDYTDQSIDVEVRFATEITVKTWGKPSIYFKADITTEDGKFLDHYTLDIDESPRRVSIESKPESIFEQFREDWKKHNPGKKRRYYSGEEYEFNYTLYVPKGVDLTISSINGHLNAETIEGTFTADLINGDIEIAKYSGHLDLKTINGEIDLKMDNAEITAETIHGDIYADESLDFHTSNRHVGQKISGKTGSASNHLRLNTINGNMYLRI